ncbi:signal peptidase [Cellulomonas sp. PhB150]|nr:signal peptidase [Cellulomonas sp. PhB150]
MLRAGVSVLFYGAIALAAWFLWPTSLGGCTTMTVVSGHSMEPTFYTGDIVLARCGQPAVGDIVVYSPPGIGGDARIIHRIVDGTPDGWTLQGDNNDFIDAFTPTDADVVGIAKIRIPKLALLGSALTSPYVWCGMIALSLALLMWPRNDDEDAAPVSGGSAEAPEDEAPADPVEQPDSLALPSQKQDEPELGATDPDALQEAARS